MRVSCDPAATAPPDDRAKSVPPKAPRLFWHGDEVKLKLDLIPDAGDLRNLRNRDAKIGVSDRRLCRALKLGLGRGFGGDVERDFLFDIADHEIAHDLEGIALPDR